MQTGKYLVTPVYIKDTSKIIGNHIHLMFKKRKEILNSQK